MHRLKQSDRRRSVLFLLLGVLPACLASVGCSHSESPIATTPAVAAPAVAAPPTEAPSNAAAPPLTGAAASREGDVLAAIGRRKKGVDWPTFLGPTGDSKSPETGVVAPWPAAGPRIVWQRELGISYDIGSVSRGRFYQFDRYDDPDALALGRGGKARLVCLNAETGEELWKFEYPTQYEDLYGYNGGPRCSPIIDGNRVYLFGVEGMLHCLNATTGDLVWKLDTSERFGVVQNFFGVGSTPVIEGDLLIVMIGGSPPEARNLPPGQLDRVEGAGTGVVAFDKFTGAVRYRLSDELASYASLKLATIGDRRWCFAFLRGGLLGFEPSQGKADFFYPWRAKIMESVNASVPVVVGDQVFISETYGVGSSLLAVKSGGHQVVWSDDVRKREKAMKCHWNTPIYVDGHLYGCSGRNPPDADLRCIDWKTGELKWSEPHRYRSSLLYVDGHFVAQGEYGQLQLLKANPEKYEVVSEVLLRRREEGPQTPGLQPTPLLKYPCWSAPILSHGLLYVRGDDRLVCLELIPE